MRIDWTLPAEANLDEIVRFIAIDNPIAALAQEDRILAAVSRLATYPRLGRVGRLPASRELVVPGTAFIVIYRVGTARVEVLNVVHGAQAWPPEIRP